MDKLNLDCDSYKDEEIDKLLHLKKPYTQNDITNAKQRLRGQIINNKNLESEKQREILFFIDTISQRIINKLVEINNINNNSDTLLSNSVVTEQVVISSLSIQVIQKVSIPNYQRVELRLVLKRRPPVI